MRKFFFIFMLFSLYQTVTISAQEDPKETPTPPPETTPIPVEALPDLEGLEITVLVENQYLPFNFIDPKTSEGLGWDYDTIREICIRLNCQPIFVEFEWEDTLNAIGEGKYDLAANGITITEERAELVEFSIPYMQLAQVILVRADEERFDSAELLAINSDLVVASRPETTNFDLTTELVGAERIQLFLTFDLAVDALLENEIDAIIIDDVAGQRYLKTYEDELKVMGVPLTSEELGFAFPPDSDLVESFDSVLLNMQDDGTLDELFIQWFIEFDDSK